MCRINIFESHDDHTVVGWFDYDKAAVWDDRDPVTGSSGTERGEGVVRTAGGIWLQQRRTNWEGETDTYVRITAEEARDWLIANYEDEAVARYFGALAEEEHRGPGRPVIGDPINVRFFPGQLVKIDAYRKAQGADGIKRADAVRQLVDKALADLEAQSHPSPAR
jgi:hypothetical protein